MSAGTDVPSASSSNTPVDGARWKDRAAPRPSRSPAAATEAEILALWRSGRLGDRREALRLLGALTDRRTAQALAEQMLAEPPEPPLRVDELEQLAEIAPDLAARASAEAIRDAQDRRPRLHELVEDIGSPDALPPLLEAWEGSQDLGVSRRVSLARTLDSLGESGPLSDLERLQDEQVRSGQPEDRADGMVTALALGDAGACSGGLLDGAGIVRLQAARCLSMVGSEADVAALESLGADPDPEISRFGPELARRLRMRLASESPGT